MIGEIRQILGKTVSGVIVKKRDGPPRSQVFLLFTDNTYYELYGDWIDGTSGLSEGDREVVLKYMSRGEVVLDTHVLK